MKNEVDFRKLDQAIEGNPQMKILWKYVPAHVGIRGNERADELARQGALSYKKWCKFDWFMSGDMKIKTK